VVTESAAVTSYCGTFTSTSGGASGKWTLASRGNQVHGEMVDSAGNQLPLDGTMTGSTVSIVNPLAPAGPPLATGTLSGSTLTGTFNTGSNSGNWTATLCP
jgi:hypothetical protein